MIDEELKRRIARQPQLNQIIKQIRSELAAKGFNKQATLKQTLQLLAANEPTLREFLSDLTHCTAGPMSACQQPNVGFEKQISYHNGKFYLDLAHCQHWKLAHHHELRQRYLIYSDYNLNELPEQFDDALMLLDHVEAQFTITTNQNRKQFFHQAWKILKQNTSKGLYLIGPPDYGKTFLFRLLVNCWVTEEQSRVALVRLPKLINDCRNLLQKKAGDRQQKLLQKLKEVDILFLDELGSESISRWGRDEILCELLNYRCDQAKLTFINSNFTWNQLAQHYLLSQENRAIDQVKVKRLISRLRRLTSEWNLIGKKISR